jgi:ubiquinone/menaquinone biosynthesis C-methylase UbiE
VSVQSVRPVFDRVARLYDNEVLQALAYRPAQDEVVSVLRLVGSRRVLDVGCGTGILAARLSDEAGPELVVGCDFSAGMLEQARARSSSVAWVQGDASRLPLPGGTVDAVVSTQAFHFFPQAAALAEFRRVLAPGGYLVVGLVNPRSDSGSRLMGRLGARFVGAGYWPTRVEMKRQVEAAGVQVRRQRPVGAVSWLVPTLVTVAVKA